MHVKTRAAQVQAADLNERAQLAVKTFRGMQSSLSAYARAITGNKRVRVQAAAGVPQTDGTVIYYQPPIALGDKTPHDRFLCDKRDENGLQSCPACKIREEVMVNIRHEIAHIAFGTFEKVSEQQYKEAIQRAIDEWGTKYSAMLKKRFEVVPPHMFSTHGALAAFISPFLPELFNAVEDARIDTAMFEARKGTYKMLKADTFNLLRNGLPDAKGEFHKWDDAPANAQITLGCYLGAVGFDGWQEYLHPQIGEHIADAKVSEILGQIAHAPNAEVVYSLTFPLLARLRELGYFIMPEDEDQQPEPEPEKGDESEDQQDDQQDNDEQEENDEKSDEADSSDDSDQREAEADASDPGQEGEADGDPESGDEPETEGEGEEADSEPEAGDAGDEGTDGEADQGESGGDAPSDQGPAGDEGDEAGEAEGGDGDAPDENGAESGASGGEGEASEDSEADGEGGEPSGDESGSEGAEAGDPSSDPGEPGSDQSAGGAGGESPDAPSDDRPEGEPGGTPDRSVDGDEGSPESEGDSSDEAVDGAPVESGADQGLGGVKVSDDGPEMPPLPDYGTAEDVAAALQHAHELPTKLEPGDEVKGGASADESAKEKAAVLVAIIQGIYFETPSTGVSGVEEHVYGPGAWGWSAPQRYHGLSAVELGIDCDMDVPESILGPALLKTRRVFDDNKKAEFQRNRRSGSVNAKVLGRRAWNDDDRLFMKKQLPGKKDYAVLIGMDISSSNLGDNLALLKRSVGAQAELLARCGIKFKIVAHSAEGGGMRGTRGYTMHLSHVKDWDEPWDSTRQERLDRIAAVGGNLDGHALEYMRRQMERVQTTDKIILYYTDGKMPAANKEEELEVLIRQIGLCKRDRVTLLGVGIRTDSPRAHGLDTVEVHTDEDLPKVVEHLGKRLTTGVR